MQSFIYRVWISATTSHVITSKQEESLRKCPILVKFLPKLKRGKILSNRWKGFHLRISVDGDSRSVGATYCRFVFRPNSIHVSADTIKVPISPQTQHIVFSVASFYYEPTALRSSARKASSTWGWKGIRCVLNANVKMLFCYSVFMWCCFPSELFTLRK